MAQRTVATLVLFVATLGRRIEEAVGLQPGDLDDAGVLHIRRVLYDSKVELLEKEQSLPLDATVHADLIRRLRALGEAQKWVFHSRAGTPVSPGNARRR